MMKSLTREQMRQRWLPTGRVIIPFLGSSGQSGWPAGRWDIWAPVFTWKILGRRRPTLWVELHRRCWWHQPKAWRKGYRRWLQTYRARPILMQHRFSEVPASVRYPREIVQGLFSQEPFHGTFDWLMALAIYLEAKQVRVWGVDYNSAHEVVYQRGGAAFWVGLAIGAGIEVGVSPTSELLSNPMPSTQTYGYDYPPWPKGHHPKDWPDHLNGLPLAPGR